jgi:16S rRNA (cytosine967-C5)-methyltransferase
MKKKQFDLKQYHSQVKAVFNILREMFEEGVFADRAIEHGMRSHKKWRGFERAFVSETTYDIVRNWRLLTTVAGIEPELSEKNLWTIFGTWLVMQDYDLPPSPQFRHLNPQAIERKLAKFNSVRKIRESIPDWLDELGERELGRAWDKVIRSMNATPEVYVRVNKLKTSIQELIKIFEEEKIDAERVQWSPDALRLKRSGHLFRTEAFRQGLFEVQDAASQMVSIFTGAKPGDRVVDGCAGSGGKTLHLASIMKNKGRIIALDTKEWKLKELKKRAARAGASIIDIRFVDSSKVIKRLNDSADCLLLDVPCSGLGVLRRNPDTKWKLQPEEIERVKQVQLEILERYSPITKQGGKMIYVTCSILPSEGEEQVKKFVDAHPDSWKVVEERRYSPAEFDCDGFYMASLERLK